MPMHTSDSQSRSSVTADELPSGALPAPVRLGLSYRTKLVLGICSLVFVTGATITWLTQRSARASTEVLVESLFREVSGHAVSHTRSFVMRARPLVESLQQLGENGLALDDSD